MALTVSTLFRDDRKDEGFPMEKQITLSRTNGVVIPFSIGLGIDCNATPYTITVEAYGLGANAVGWKSTRTIHNQTGTSDVYDYKIENLTKGTTLSSVTGHTLIDGEFTVVSEFWSLDDINEKDGIRFTISQGIIGTNAGRATLGTISFFLESIDKSIIT